MTVQTSRSVRALFVAAFITGLAALAWVASGFVGSSVFALGMTLLIGAVYLAGALELHRFGQATTALHAAVCAVPQPLVHLSDWLSQVPEGLRHAVGQRIEAERSAFPGMGLTPYLVGLLVMLGMLGTFLGMVVTFRGAVFALEGSADLQAMRAALAAPIKGLGLSFGTSVAGVATSAMLGLMATLARRERGRVLRQLDALAATTLRPFTAAHQRQQGFEALQRQAQALPAAAQHLQTLNERLEQRSRQLDEQLLSRHDAFQREAVAAYTQLAQSVGRSLCESLAVHTRSATEGLQPLVQQALAGVAAESAQLHASVGTAVQTQLEGLAQSLQQQWQQAGERAQAQQQVTLQALTDTATAITEIGREQALRNLDGVTRLIERTEALVQARADAQAQWAGQYQQRMDDMAALWRDAQATLRADEAARGDAAVQRLADLQTALAQQLAALGSALEAPLTRLMHTAAQAPQAAAELMQHWRGHMDQWDDRQRQHECTVLAERSERAGQWTALLQQVHAATAAQGVAIEQLVGSASQMLDQVGQRFADTVDLHSRQAGAMAEQATTRAAELTQLGQALQQGSQQWAASQAQLVQSLQRVEDAIGQSMARSDEQLAYYVAQAREVIDLSISAQQGIIDDLRRLRENTRASAAAGAA